MGAFGLIGQAQVRVFKRVLNSCHISLSKLPDAYLLFPSLT